MNDMKVTFASLEGAHSQLVTTRNQMDNELAALRTTVDNLTTTWTGSAQESYVAEQARWDKAVRELHTTLDRIGVALGQAIDGYRTTETTNASKFRPV